MIKLPPLWQISSNTNSICNIGTACAIYVIGGGGGGVRNPIDGELLPHDILSGGTKSTGERNPRGRKAHVTPCAWMCGQQNTHRVAVEYSDILIS